MCTQERNCLDMCTFNSSREILLCSAKSLLMSHQQGATAPAGAPEKRPGFLPIGIPVEDVLRSPTAAIVFS